METQYWLFDATTRKYLRTNLFTEQPENSVDFEPTITDAEQNAVLNEDATAWVDCRTSDILINAKIETYKDRIVECVKHLRDRALISSISKEKDIEYLKGQADVYKSKYGVAKQYCIDQTINDNDWYNAILNEMNNTNAEFQLIETSDELTIPIFMNYIKVAFETGLERSKKFEPSIEIFRCKAKDLAVVKSFTRCDAMLTYAYNLPSQMELSEVDGFLNDINAI